MENITQRAIAELIDKEPSNISVTIYCPMHKAASSPHMTEEQIRFKNLVHKAVGLIKERGGSAELEKELSNKLDELLSDQNFWESQTESLLLCAQPGLIRMFHLPIDTEEYVAVDDSFHLAPVLGILQAEGAFYVLSVNQHNPKLLKGDMYGLSETGVVMPASVEEGLNLDEVNQKSEHARSAVGLSIGTTGFHGRGGARNPQEEDRARFFRMIDQIVYNNTDRSLPLILVGTDSETAEFRALSMYPKITDKTVHGSYSDAKPQELSELVYQIVQEEIVAREHQAVLNEYDTIKGTNPERVATSKEAISRAADQGRIDKLLIRVLRTTTDTVRDSRNAMSLITFPEVDLSATINRLANKVWQTRGQIVGLNATEMPDGAPMVARLRY